MGEIAEMMLNGEMCQWCGEFMDNPQGFPSVCAACLAADRKRKKTAKAEKSTPQAKRQKSKQRSSGT